MTATPTTEFQENAFSRYLLQPPMAATCAGLMEVTFYHPIDTISKRLMSHQERVITGNLSQTLRNLSEVIHHGEKGGIVSTLTHLYRGTQYAVYYKVSQRVIKFAGQPYVKDYMHKHHKSKFDDAFGHKVGKPMMEASAGAIVGVSEIVVLPFDRMKVLNQTNRGALKSRNIASVALHEGPRKLWAGAGTTAIRNIPGSFILFGGTALTKDLVFKLEDHRKATWGQNMVCSTVGASMGVFFTSPMDVVKTRIQNKSFTEGRVTGMQIFMKVVRSEGISAFYKGIIPKIITTSPKLVFTYTVTEGLVSRMKHHKAVEKAKWEKAAAAGSK